MDDNKKMEVIIAWAMAYRELKGCAPSVCPGGMELDYICEEDDTWYALCLNFDGGDPDLVLWKKAEHSQGSSAYTLSAPETIP